MKNLYAIVIILLLFGTGTFAQAIFEWKQNTPSSNLHGFLYTASNVSFKNEKEILGFQKIFTKSDEPVVNFGESNADNWLYFKLKNTESSSQELVLFLDQTFLDKADFYQFEADSLVQEYTLNDRILAKNRPLAHNNFTYKFSVKPNVENTIFLRLKTNPQNGIAKALVTLSSEPQFHRRMLHRYVSFGILLGILILSVAAAAILFYNRPKPVYIIYAFYVACLTCTYLSNYGYLNGYFGHEGMGTAQFYLSMLMMGAGIQLLFLRTFLSLPTRIPAVYDRFIQILCVYFLVLSIANYVLPATEFLPKLSRFSFVILILVLFGLSFWSIYNRSQAAKYYLVAFTPSLLLVLYFVLTTLKILPVYDWAYLFPFPCSTYEIAVFGFGLLYVYTKEKENIKRQLAQERQLATSRIITTQEQERQKIAQDLHDDLGSTLSLLNNLLSVKNDKLSQQLNKEFELSDKAVNDLREVSHNLMPTMFLERGLKTALEDFVENNRSLQEINLTILGNEHRLEWETELSIFRIAKELITNAIKHAQARTIEVQLLYYEKFLYLSVEDDGIGFGKNSEKKSGIGLKNINLRVDYLNGRLNRESSDEGSIVSIEIPYVASQPKNQDTSR
jgi:signal transduction histidine kinase